MYKTLTVISSWSVMLPFVVGLFLTKSLWRHSQLIFLVVAIGVIPQLIHFFNPRSTTEIISYNLYTIAEFFIYFILFNYKIKVKGFKQIYHLMSFMYIVICSFLVAQFGLQQRFINELAVINGIACLLMIGFYLIQTFKHDSGELATNNSFFWYTVGVLLYASCTTLVYSLWQKIVNNPESILQNLWNLQNLFNIATYVLFAIGFIVDWRQNKLIKSNT
jgi:hypothetical protein